MSNVDQRAVSPGATAACTQLHSAAGAEPRLGRQWLATIFAVTATPIFVALGRALTSDWLPRSCPRRHGDQPTGPDAGFTAADAERAIES